MVEHEVTGWIDRFSLAMSRVMMLLPGIIVLIIIWEVVLRYVFEKPTIWVNETSLWLGGVIYLTAGIYAMQQRAHIRIFLLYDVVPRWLQKTFDVLSVSFLTLWCAAVIYGFSNEAITGFLNWEKFDSAWAPPIPAISQPLVILSMILITLQAISNLIMDWNKLPEHLQGMDDHDAEIEEIKRAQGVLDDKE